MAPIKFLLALSSLAILSCSFGATPVNALSVESHHNVNRAAHGVVAKHKRDQSSRCKPRPSSTALSLSSDKPAPSSSAAQPLASSSKAPPHSSSAAPPAHTSSTADNQKGKVGLAWALGNDPRLKLLATPRTNYLYTWGPTYPSDVHSLGLTPVPQLWGWKQVDQFKQTVVKGYANIVLGMNEPNQQGQSDMSAQSGAQLWKQYIQPLKNEGYRLGSPATTSAPNGMTWMKDFLAACDGCTLDFVALHWYDTTFDKFKTYVELWHNTFNKPLWITEFACQNFNGGAQPSTGDIWNFYSQAIKYLDDTDFVEMYAPFGFMDDMQNVNPADGLFSGNSLSALGWLIINGLSN